MYMIIATFS